MFYVQESERSLWLVRSENGKEVDRMRLCAKTDGEVPHVLRELTAHFAAALAVRYHGGGGRD